MAANNEFEKPKCWDDDERMNALFQPFRPKQINPAHYKTKLLFWQDLIYDYCKYKKGNPNFSRKEIQLEFKRKGRLPLCLEIVIDDMIEQKIIQKRDDILSNPYNTWTTWAVNSFFKTPVKWGYNIFWGKSDIDSEEIKYYHIPLLKELSNELLQILTEHSGKVLKTEDISIISKSKIHLNENGLIACLFHLHQQNKILLEFDIIKDDLQITLVKIPGKYGTQEKFNEYDKSMIQLQETKSVLLSQISEFEKEITKYQEMARKCMKDNNKRMAKIHLRRKLFVQNQCDKKSNILHNVETLITNIEDAQSNGEILNVYKMGSDSLKSLMSKSGLTSENVDEIISTMHDVVEEHNEIQNSLSNIDNTSLNATSDEILEDELKEILSEDFHPNKIDLNKNADNERKLPSDDEILRMLENLRVETSTPNTSVVSPKKIHQ